MKLEDTHGAKDEYTGKASEVSRQLAFAAIAVVWIFKTDLPKGGFSVPHELYWPALLAVATLASDLLQYAYASLAWSLFNRRKEIELKHDGEKTFTAPRWINWPTLSFFWLKLVLVIFSYVLLLRYLLRTIS